MKQMRVLLGLALAAVILSGCAVVPLDGPYAGHGYGYRGYRPYRDHGPYRGPYSWHRSHRPYDYRPGW
jgi:hypothetical protein